MPFYHNNDEPTEESPPPPPPDLNVLIASVPETGEGAAILAAIASVAPDWNPS